MSHTSAASRSSVGRRRPPSGVLVGLALAAGFLWAPVWVTGGRLGTNPFDDGPIRTLARSELTAWLGSGRDTLGADLARAVTDWRLFHMVKAVLALMLLAVALACVRRLGQAVSRRLAGATALAALIALAANVQGAITPLASLASFGPIRIGGGNDPTAALATELTGSLAWPLLLEDFTRFHVTMAIIAVIATLGLGVLTARALVRRRTTATVSRGLMALAWALIAAANVSTALAPASALLAALASR